MAARTLVVDDPKVKRVVAQMNQKVSGRTVRGRWARDILAGIHQRTGSDSAL